MSWDVYLAEELSIQLREWPVSTRNNQSEFGENSAQDMKGRQILAALLIFETLISLSDRAGKISLWHVKQPQFRRKEFIRNRKRRIRSDQFRALEM